MIPRETLKITVLGSGTSTGIPVVGCRCPVCLSAHPCNCRTRCSALLSFGKYNILIDTSTDLRQQALREDIRHIDAVFFTHCHADHLHGIDDLRSFNLHSGKPIPIYGNEQTMARIRNSFSYIFDDSESSGYIPRLTLHPLSDPVYVFGLEIIPVPLVHGRIETFGYRCGPLAYLTDCNEIPKSSLQLLENLELLILDGLRFTPHRTHFNVPQAIEAARAIGARQTLLTHLSHEVDHPVHDPQLPEGINFAYDGQSCSFQVEPLKTNEEAL